MRTLTGVRNLLVQVGSMMKLHVCLLQSAPEAKYTPRIAAEKELLRIIIQPKFFDSGETCFLAKSLASCAHVGGLFSLAGFDEKARNPLHPSRRSIPAPDLKLSPVSHA